MLTIFITSFLLLFYIFIGYPVILYVLSKKCTVPTFVTDAEDLSLCILMVVCNEERLIKKKLDNLLKLESDGALPDIYIVDDCSDDETTSIIESENNNRLIVIRQSERSGKASGINLAMKSISTDLVMLVDVRQEIELDAAVKLAQWFRNDSKVGAISGELNFKTDEMNEFAKGIDGYWRYEKFIRKAESRISNVPGVTGAIYMLRKSAYIDIPADTILDDVAIPMNVISEGYRVGFDDQAVAWDVPSSNKSNEKKRKVRTIKGNYQLFFRNFQWIVPGLHPAWWQFLSHKVLRLFAPILMLANLVAALFLSLDGGLMINLYLTGFIVFLLVYPAGILFPTVLNNSILRLISSFLSLNWFNLLGLYSYLFIKQHDSWKTRLDTK